MGGWPRTLRVLGSTLGAMSVLVLLIASATASASGFDQSFSQSPTTSDPNVGLVQLTTTYASGPNLTCSFAVAGTIVLTNSEYGYAVYFGGNSTTNSRAYAAFSGNTTRGILVSPNLTQFGFTAGVEPLVFELSAGGSTLTFGVATALVGPASDFSVLAEAHFANATSEQSSSLGGASHSSAGTSLGGDWLGFLVAGVIGAVVVAAAVVLLGRRKRRPPSAGGAP